MTGPFRIRACNECSHQILNGIACDWQPNECPFQAKKKSYRKQSRTEAFFISSSLIADDFDAVRSSN
jgi:hypothetical protein